MVRHISAANNQSGLSEFSNDASISRRSAPVTILFDEEPMFSDSEDEFQFYQSFSQVLVSSPSVKTPNTETPKAMSINEGNNHLYSFLSDQLLLLGCDQCACCKNFKDFLTLESTAEVSRRSSSSLSSDSGLGPLFSDNGPKRPKLINPKVLPPQKITLISDETLLPLKFSVEVDNSNKHFVLGIPNNAKTVDENVSEIIHNENTLSDSTIIDDDNFDQNCSVISTCSNVWKVNHEKVHAKNNLPGLQNISINTQKPKEYKEGGATENVRQGKKKLVLKTKRRQINQSSGNIADFVTENSCDLPVTVNSGREFDSSNLNSSLGMTQSAAKKRKGRPRKSAYDEVVADSCDGNLICPVDPIPGHEQKIKKSTVKKRRGRPRKSPFIEVNADSCDDNLICQVDPVPGHEQKLKKSMVKRRRGRPRKSPFKEVIADSCDDNLICQVGPVPVPTKKKLKKGPKKLTSNKENMGNEESHERPALIEKIQGRKSEKAVLTINPIEAESDPYDLKTDKTRSKMTLPFHHFKNPSLNMSVDTTSHRTVSKAISRKLGRTGGFSFHMGDLNRTNDQSRSFETRKSRTLYSPKMWLNSDEFLRLISDK